MNMPKDQRAGAAVGHYAAIYGTNCAVPTTITNQRKSHAKEIAAAKRKELLSEIRMLTGVEYSGYSQRFDSVVRRWNGIKSNGSD